MPDIRAILVDDEPLGRERIRTLLSDVPDVELVAECADGREALEAVERVNPDLMFLDVQMPELDGFDVLDALDPETRPFVIFVTAYDQYAIRAFDVHALDYLLKPFDRERFDQALARARASIAAGREDLTQQRMLDLIEQLRVERGPLERLVVKSAGRIVFLRAEEIDWIEAAGNYLKIHAGPETHLLRETMNTMQQRLSSDHFARIHRSTIVNLDRIRELQPAFHGEYVVILRDGVQLTLSRSHRDTLAHLLEQA